MLPPSIEAVGTCYAPPSPQDPWCSGPTCQPVTLEIAGSNPVGSAINPNSSRPVRPPGRGVLLPRLPSAGDDALGPPPPLTTPAAAQVAAPVHRSGDHRRGVRAGRGPRRERAQRRLERVADAAPSATLRAAGSPSPSSTASGSPSTASPSPSDADTTATPSRHRRRPPSRRSCRRRHRPGHEFRSGQAKVALREDIDLLGHGTGPYKALTLVASDADAILQAIRADRATLGDRLKTVKDATALASDLSKHRDRLAFLRVGDVTPAVRALGWGARELFGVAHADPAEWPLSARLAVAQGATPDASPVWTLVAGGDILLDRGVRPSRSSAKGRNFLFDGHGGDHEPLLLLVIRLGAAADPARRRPGLDARLPQVGRSGDRELREPGARPASLPRRGTVFSADPKQIKALGDAGIDWVSIANNHIGDAGGRASSRRSRTSRGTASRRPAPARTSPRHAPARSSMSGTSRSPCSAYDTIAALLQGGRDTPGSAQMSQDRHEG